MNDPKELLSRLAAPFAAEDLEWRLQIAYEDRMQGIAVPYVTNRAIQNRLDDVMGPDRWHNEFKPWHSTGKRESQLCGISLYFEERGWITKWDGAEDSDIEPIKGGLSDSMKRAANQWGIGRVLYSMDTVWVNVEKKGKSFIIKPTERGKLDARYFEGHTWHQISDKTQITTRTLYKIRNQAVEELAEMYALTADLQR